MGKMKTLMLSLFLIGLGQANSNELDDLINTSDVLLGQIDQSIAYVGWSMDSTFQGMIAANGLYEEGLITEDQLSYYNNAVVSFASFDPYGSAAAFLMSESEQELLNMNAAVDTFTDVVVEMTVVLEVNELAVEAQEAGVGDPAAAQEVVDFVNEREDAGMTLQVSQEQVETFNQSVEDIDTSAGNAAAFIAVASSEEATEFLNTEARTVNDSFDNPEVGVSFDRASGAVSVAWNSASSMELITAVYVNNHDFGIDAFVSSASVLDAGYESQLYLPGPPNLGYNCFFQGIDCDYSPEETNEEVIIP